jgi:N,N'-diacetyllegionaminate synthase
MKKFNNKKPYLIAEIGVNHNGSIEIAKRLIKHAKVNNFNAVKFQTYLPNKLLLKNTPLVNYQKGNKNVKNMYELLKKYQISFNQFAYLKDFCDKLKIEFLSTPFDIESALFLHKLKIPIFKISSTDNDNFLLLEVIKKFKKPILLSLGMIEEKNLKKTLNFLKIKKDMLCLMHCISNYPTELKDTQFGYFEKLKKFKYPLGWSDHTKGNIASTSAVALGAVVVEKHITLDNNMVGPDHKASMNVKNLKKFTENIHDIFLSIKTLSRKIDTKENQVKKLAKKSLYYVSNLNKGEIIKESNLQALRPRANGISPNQILKIRGKKLIKNVKKDFLISLKHLKK